MNQRTLTWMQRGVVTCTILIGLATSAHAVDLIGYFALEGNANDSAGAPNNGTIVASGSTNSFVAGFRGQGWSKTAGGSGGGDTITLPFSINKGVNPTVTFGGWVLSQSAGSFDGFMAADNGGWDRGIVLNSTGGQWGIASGNSPTTIPASVADGQWRFVVGSFNGSTAQLYVGTDSAGTPTTLSASMADNQSGGDLGLIEVGRYDNQDFAGIVDDLFVFDDALNTYQINAIRNLRLTAALDYEVSEVDQLLDLFQAGSGSVLIDGLTWTNTNGLNPLNPGQVFNNGNGSFSVVLNGSGAGLIGAAAVPEPATIATWLFAGAICIAFGWRCRSKRTRK